MSFCIFPGTFNPIHIGHVKIAEYVLKNMAFDKIVFIPSYFPPHKEVLETPFLQRFEMVKLAIHNIKQLEVSDIEKKINVGNSSYTIDTVKNILNTYNLQELHMIIGEDAFENIQTWKNTESLKELVNFIVFKRKDFNDEEILNNLKEAGYKFEIMDMPEIDISSTNLRLGLQTSGIEAVDNYIKNNKVYDKTFNEYINSLKQELLKTLDEERYEHSLGVAECAEQLAVKYNINSKQAYIAGLMHDCAKCLPKEILTDNLKQVDDLTQNEINATKTYHAPVGKIWAEKKFGINNPEILSAIRWHTIAKAPMTEFEKIIYLADKIELKTRPKERVIPIINKLTEKNGLNKAILMCIENTIDVLKQRGVDISEYTVKVHNYFLKEVENA